MSDLNHCPHHERIYTGDLCPWCFPKEEPECDDCEAKDARIAELERQLEEVEGPSWKDAPDAPGTWVVQTPSGAIGLINGLGDISAESRRYDPTGVRWYGPIPVDADSVEGVAE